MISEFLRDAILNQLFGNATFPTINQIFIGLSTTIPDRAGTNLNYPPQQYVDAYSNLLTAYQHLPFGPSTGAWGTVIQGVTGPALEGAIYNIGGVNFGPTFTDYGAIECVVLLGQIPTFTPPSVISSTDDVSPKLSSPEFSQTTNASYSSLFNQFPPPYPTVPNTNLSSELLFYGQLTPPTTYNCGEKGPYFDIGQITVAMAGNVSDNFRNAILTGLFQGAPPISWPAEVFLSLSTVPIDENTGVLISSPGNATSSYAGDPNYVPQNLTVNPDTGTTTMAPSAHGICYNYQPIVFPPPSIDWPTIVNWVIVDYYGNILLWGPIKPAANLIANGPSFVLTVGQLEVSLDGNANNPM